VSKQRPSNRAPTAALTPHRSSRASKPNPWLRRVFHNSYTRQGRRIAVRGWSAKLQHQRRRRTFRLVAETKAAAAAEAQAIHQVLLSEGWDVVDQQYAGPSRARFQKAEIPFWKARLLLRHQSLRGAPEHEFSVRIGRGGSNHYFPLGVADADAAAAKALRIYRSVLTKSWDTVRRLFPREVTIAFHWAHNPVLWTYTTLHTLAGQRPGPPSRPIEGESSEIRIFVVESDAELRNVLARCIDQHKGCRCEVCADANFARGLNSCGAAALWLVNSDLADKISLTAPGHVGLLASGAPVVTYSVHANSDEAFLALPGGMSGYGLKRMPPHRILEPIVGALGSGVATSNAMSDRIHSYFQQVFSSPSTQESPRTMAHLTQREQDVLNLLSKAYVNKEIAQTLGISAWTVHEHVKRVFEKLRVHSRLEAAMVNLQK
jgi:DNA-binding NarL/FixJ family response regulator